MATARWLASIYSCDDQHERFAEIVEHLWAAAEKLCAVGRVHSRAEAYAVRGRQQCAETSFWALDGHDRLFQRAARTYFNLPASRHHALTTALLLPPPLGTKWQIAVSPIGMVVDAVRRNYQDDVESGGKIKRTDAMFYGVDHCGNDRPETVALEEVADVPSDAVLVRQFTDRSLAELQRAFAEDNDIRTYLQARLSPGGTLEEICRYLKWTNARGQRVSHRFRRIRDHLLEQTDLREDHVVAARGDRAPATWYLERLYSGLGVYQHVHPGPPEFYGRKPVKD